MAQVVFAFAENRNQLAHIVGALKDHRFPGRDISVVMPRDLHDQHLVHELHSKAPEGAVTGGIAGGLTGGVLGLLAGLGSLSIPGLGVLMAVGPLFGALSGLGAGGAVGGLAGGLIGLGIPEVEAQRYEQRIREGHILVSVHCADEHDVRLAKQLLEQYHAEHVATAPEAQRPPR